MNKTIFEQMGGIYTETGDYILPKRRKTSYRLWGHRRLRYLKQHHKIIYYNLLTSGKLQSHLADIEDQAQELFLRLVNEYAEREGIAEQLKITDPMAWVRKMNNIQSRVIEVVSKEFIYT